MLTPKTPTPGWGGGLKMLSPKNPPGTPWGGVGQICLGPNDSQINPHMRAKFGRDPTGGSKKKRGYRQTHKGTLKLYIVDVLYPRGMTLLIK